MPISKSQMRAVAKYNRSHYKRVAVVLTYQQKEDIQAAAERAGETMSQYMKKATFSRMESEKEKE